MPTQEAHESRGAQLLRQLFTHGKRIFTMQDALDAASTLEIPANQVRKIFSNLAKRKQIIRLRRGLYVSSWFLSADQKDIHPFVVSAYLIRPSAISHWSALQQHGLTEQIPQVITASTPKKVVTPSMRSAKTKSPKHMFEIAGIHYKYIQIQTKHFFGTEKLWLDEQFLIHITDKERTLLDLFVYSKMFGGMGEVLGILENALPEIDTRKLVMYAIKYEQKAVAKRVGWALEYFGVSGKQLTSLLKVPIRYYCRLDPSLPAKGPCDKHWMIQNNLVKSK